MDLTTLNDDDTPMKVDRVVCHQAKTPVGNTAAFVFYPRFYPDCA